MSLDTFPSRPFKTLTDMREEAEDVPSNRSGNPTMGDVINARMSRRGMLTGSLAVSAIAATVSPMAFLAGGRAHAQGAGSAFGFTEIAAGVDETHHVAEGYDAKVLLRWGDPVTAGAPDFDPMNQTAEAQARQFGYNNDYIGFVPLDGSETRGLLLVNHEYTDAHLMFPGIASVVDGKVVLAPHTKEMVDIEMAAHGGTVVEIVRDGDSLVGGQGQPAQPPHHRLDAHGSHRPGRRPRPPQDLRGSDRHAGARHHQQLRRRRHALGHVSDGRGELPRLLRRRDDRGPPGIRQLRALRRARRRLQLGELLRPLRHRERAQRRQPLRLDRRGRPLGSDLDAEKAHRDGPLQA